MLSKKSIVMFVVVLITMAVAQVSVASEPINNNLPTGSLLWYGDASVMECGVTGNGCGFPQESISSTTDVDNFVALCGQSSVRWIGITMQSESTPFTNLDMVVYKPNGEVIGTATSTTRETEYVWATSTSLNGVVVKVYGVNGALNSYNLTLRCE